MQPPLFACLPQPSLQTHEPTPSGPTQVLNVEPSPVYGCLLFPCVAKGRRYYSESDVESSMVQVGGWGLGFECMYGDVLLLHPGRCRVVRGAGGWLGGWVVGLGLGVGFRVVCC